MCKTKLFPRDIIKKIEVIKGMCQSRMKDVIRCQRYMEILVLLVREERKPLSLHEENLALSRRIFHYLLLSNLMDSKKEVAKKL